jgi:hypothetical protein
LGCVSSIFGVIIIGARNQRCAHAIVEEADYSIIGWDIRLAGDSQTPYLTVVEEFTTVVAIAYWAKSAFGSVDEISTHNSPPDRRNAEMRNERIDLNKKSLILAVERSKEPPSQFLASFMETLQKL